MARVEFQERDQAGHFIIIIGQQVFIAGDQHILFLHPLFPDVDIFHDEVNTLLKIGQVREGVGASFLQGALTIVIRGEHGIARVAVNVRDPQQAQALQKT